MLSIISSSFIFKVPNIQVLFNIFARLKSNLPLISLLALFLPICASFSPVLFLGCLSLLPAFFSLSQGWIGGCCFKDLAVLFSLSLGCEGTCFKNSTFTLRAANFFNLRWRWTGTCFMRVSSSLCYLVHFNWWVLLFFFFLIRS